MESVHDPKYPRNARFNAWTMAAFVVLLALSIPLWLIIGLSGERMLLFIIMAVPTLLFLPAVIYISAATPPVTLTDEGVRLRPIALWRERFIPWEQIDAAKVYPLIPSAETEIVRKALVGRRKYSPADGIMLVSRALPLPYRFVGFFAGEGTKGVVGLTNRTHQNYDALVKFVAKHKPIERPKSKTT